MIIGLTGGIASGKTQVSNYLASLGAGVVDADVVAREVVALGQPALSHIAKHFGREILLDDGKLNRAKLRERIFANKADKAWLEALLHPLIRTQIQAELSAQTAPYSLLVAPLLIENGLHNMVAQVWVVDVPTELQIARTQARDNVSFEQAQRIINSQLEREARLRHADEVICNDGDINALENTLNALHHRLLQALK